MLEKLSDLLDLLGQVSPAWQGFFMAIVISVLRILYDGKEKKWQRIVLESLICGCLTLGVFAVIAWLKLPLFLSVAAGGAIGFLGVMQLRALALKYLNIRVSDGRD